MVGEDTEQRGERRIVDEFGMWDPHNINVIAQVLDGSSIKHAISYMDITIESNMLQPLLVPLSCARVSFLFHVFFSRQLSVTTSTTGLTKSTGVTPVGNRSYPRSG
jgi:hypothetical protein